MNYTLDDDQLLSIWTVITCLGLIKEIPDPAYGSKLLTQAQVLLTVLVLQLSPLAEDRSNPVTVGPG